MHIRTFLEKIVFAALLFLRSISSSYLLLLVLLRVGVLWNGHLHMWFSRQFWEAFLHKILPTLSILHVSWMFRMNGISSVVPVADWVYRLTFDICNRVVPKSPGTPSSIGSSLWRIIEYNIHRVISWFVVRALRVPERFFDFFLTPFPPHITETAEHRVK